MIKTLLNVSTVSCKLYSMFEADVMYPFFHAKPSYFQLNINKRLPFSKQSSTCTCIIWLT